MVRFRGIFNRRYYWAHEYQVIIQIAQSAEGYRAGSWPSTPGASPTTTSRWAISGESAGLKLLYYTCVRFIRAKKKDKEGDKENEGDQFSAFGGSDQSLRQAKKK